MLGARTVVEKTPAWSGKEDTDKYRRSGTLLYLPDLARSCCPHHTIRLPAAEYNPTRDQRQALNRWNRFVLGEKYIKEVKKRFPKSKEEKKRERNAVPDLAASVHEPETANLRPGVEPEHQFNVTLEPDNFTDEKFALFENYQRNVHHEKPGEISKAGFKRFLCNSPIPKHRTSEGRKIGSFHQCYRLDGRLIAIGVLDLLDHAVSAVYFIYHNDFEHWSFGKLSAMREATLALEGEYQYYYMGFYIHSCVKMRYKGDYKPQYVLDAESKDWDLLDEEMGRAMESPTFTDFARKRRGLTSRASSSVAGGERTIEVVSVAVDNTQGEEAIIKHPNPTDAMVSDESLFAIGMPGMTDVAKIDEEMNVGAIKLTPGGGRVFQAEDLVIWDDSSPLDPTSLKGKFYEFAACVGPAVASEAVVQVGFR
ncbi:hypothetical protein MBLNU230_g2826t2 [Neophaeotheca triangularis]